MILSELLDELRHGYLNDTSDQINGPSDQLWSDARLVRYINEAQRRFARLTLCLRDGTTPGVTQIFLQSNVRDYACDPSVLAVLSVQYPGDTADLARANHPSLQQYHFPDTYFFDPSQLASLPPGKPLAWSTDEELQDDGSGSWQATTVRFYPLPSSAYANVNVQMRVARYPLNDLTTADMNATPEIPQDYHLPMLDWAAYLALRKVDIDAEAPVTAEKCKANFQTAVDECKRDLKRRAFAPLQFGFGRNGFSWEIN